MKVNEKRQIEERVLFIVDQIKEGLLNSSKWDRFNNRLASVADMKNEVRRMIEHETTMALNFDELFERKFKEKRDKSVEKILSLFPRGMGRLPIHEIVREVEKLLS